MDENKERGDRTLRIGQGRTLSLKPGTEQVLIRQNFARGRSKAVIVEKKRSRGSAGSEGEESLPGSPPAEVVESVAAPSEPVVIEPTESASEGLKGLTSHEMEARRQALTEAQRREEEERELRASRILDSADNVKAVPGGLEDRFVDGGDAASDEGVRGDVAPAVAARWRKPAQGELRDTLKAEKVPSKGAGREGDRRRARLTVVNALSEEGDRVRSMASIRRQRERARKQQTGILTVQQKVSREIVVPEMISIRELAHRMSERAADVVKLLMKQGQMAKVTEVIDGDIAQLLAEEMGHSVRRVADSDVEEGLFNGDGKEEDLVPRSPVVTVMGHVDHGKTSLLDVIRKSSIAAAEAGGITQHIGAYQVETDLGRITFVDTPGHAAFTAMRERGARVTDIVILVVAADDGVMPQTVEAIHHARAAEVPMIVAINKMDVPGADPDRVRVDLLQHGVVVEAMGGEVIDVEISALKSRNIDKLLEMVILQAEVLDLRADPTGKASGVVLEARLDKGRGPLATVLVQRGSLRSGDVVVAGAEWGKVRAVVSDQQVVKESVGPSCPVEILGLGGVPEAGDRFVVVEDEARAREITDYRHRQQRDTQALRVLRARGTLEKMMGVGHEEGTCEHVSLILKGDVHGSVEAIVGALEKVGSEEVKVQIVYAGVGGITETDISLASASGTIVIGFNVRANRQARDAASQKGVAIRYYSIVYELLDDMKKLMSGLLAPERRESFLGRAEVLQVFDISKVGKIAGSRVEEGRIEKGARVRLLRNDVVMHEGKLSALRRFKDDVKEAMAGQECGVAFENYHDIREGDVIECFRVEEIARSL